MLARRSLAFVGLRGVEAVGGRGEAGTDEGVGAEGVPVPRNRARRDALGSRPAPAPAPAPPAATGYPPGTLSTWNDLVVSLSSLV